MDGWIKGERNFEDFEAGIQGREERGRGSGERERERGEKPKMNEVRKAEKLPKVRIYVRAYVL